MKARGIMIPAQDLDPESDFQLFVIQDWDSDPAKCGIVSSIRFYYSSHGSEILSLIFQPFGHS